MKKINYKLFTVLLAVALIASVSIFYACKKDIITNQFDKTIKLVTLSDGSGAKSTVTLLEFTSVEHYENTITILQNQLEQYLDDFYNQHSSLSDDSINALMTQMNFNPNQPIINFLQNYGITSSMYLDYVNYEMDWLNNEELDMEESPYNYFPFSAVEMSLLNADGEVKIGDNILKLTQDGFVYIANTDVATLIRIDNGDMTALFEPTVTTNLLEKEGKGTCTSWKGKNQTFEYTSTKKVIMHVHFHAYPWKGSAGAELSSFEKKNNKWKSYSINMKVEIGGILRNKDCAGSYYLAHNSKGYKKTSNMVVYTAIWAAFPELRAEIGYSVTGTYRFAGYDKFVTL